MSENEDNFKKFQDSMQHLHGKLHVLDTPIPVEEQIVYFTYSQKVKSGKDEEQALGEINFLFDATVEHELKKQLLATLASSTKVEAFRAIEKYNLAPDSDLKNFALLALEESKMSLERSLSDEEQIFISTGLGGKGEKLRFFIVFFSVSPDGFTEFQFKTAKSEIEFLFTKNDCVVESFVENKDYLALSAIFPYKLDIKELINKAIDEVNQYGNFMRNNLLLTNVKIFSEEEIRKFIEENKQK